MNGTRYMGFTRGERAPLLCPHGHRLARTSWLLNHGFVRCEYQTTEGCACGVILYVFLVPDVSGHSFWAAEVTAQERDVIIAKQMPRVRVLEYLGATIPSHKELP